MSLSTHIFVFAIGRGSAAFVRSGLKQGFILDMGGGDLFDPARFVVKRLVPGLAQLVQGKFTCWLPVWTSTATRRAVRVQSFHRRQPLSP